MKTQVYLIGSSVVFFSYNPVGPVVLFLRSVPSALLTIDNAPSAGYVTFSQIDNTAGLPAPFLTALFADIVDAVGANYVSIPTMIAAITPAAGGGGGTVTAPDIVTYDMQYDQIAGAFVRVLTTFDPVTNVPTRQFFSAAGVPYTPTDAGQVLQIDARFTTGTQNTIFDIERRLGNIMTAAAIIDNNPSTDPQPVMTFNQVIVEAPLGGGDIAFNTSAGAQQLQIVALSGTFKIDGGSGTITYPLATAGGGVIPSFSLEAPFSKTLPAIIFTIVDGSSALLTQLLPTL